MSTAKITTPDDTFTGTIAGVSFADGKGTIADTDAQVGALDYFHRRPGYKVNGKDTTDGEAGDLETAVVPEPLTQPASSASLKVWLEYVRAEEERKGSTPNEVQRTVDDAEKLGRDGIVHAHRAGE